VSSRASKIEEERLHRYWRNASPEKGIVYFWLTGEAPPVAKPVQRQRRRRYPKTSATRTKRSSVEDVQAMP
jgi:hypothetical protein